MVCKLIKRGLIGTVLGAGALGLIFGTAAPSYVHTAFHKARSSVKGSVPIEFEIDRAKNEIAALTPAIQDGVESLVRAKIQEERLEAQIASGRDELNREGRALQALNEHLRTGDLHLTGGVAYSEKTVKNDLARRMDHYKVLKVTLAEQQETLGILHKNVASAVEGLEALKAAKVDLTARVEGAQARLNQIKAARATHRYSFDDSAIGQAKKTVSELELKLEQMSRVDELKDKYLEEAVIVTPDTSRDVSKEIEAEFNNAPKSEKSVDKY
jgi:hypothetical protein